jgi:hypothetical protein
MRLRESSGGRDDSTVKLRGKAAAVLPDAEFPLTDAGDVESKVEKDRAIGGKETRSFSITAKQQRARSQICAKVNANPKSSSRSSRKDSSTSMRRE